jgi:hypothetical protein
MATAIGAYATTALLKARLFDAGVTDTADDTLMGTIVDQVNDFIESPAGTGRVIAPITSATYLIDIPEPRTSMLYFPKGIRAITDLSFGSYTGATRTTVATTDYWLRPLAHDRKPGWPAMYVQMSDHPAGTYRYFPAGFETVSMTCTAGWAAIPDVIIDVALTTATRAWHARQNGQADLIGNDETGEPLVSRFVAPHHWRILKAYRLKQPAVIG